MKSEWTPMDLGRFFLLKVIVYPKNVNVMANYQLMFLDEKEQNDIQSFATDLFKIYIAINNDEIGFRDNAASICIDISTAIKFSKELRRQISIAKEKMENDVIINEKF